MSETTVATMKTPVPQKMPARALVTKKTTQRPELDGELQELRCQSPRHSPACRGRFAT